MTTLLSECGYILDYDGDFYYVRLARYPKECCFHTQDKKLAIEAYNERVNNARKTSECFWHV